MTTRSFLRQVVPALNLRGKSVVLDCANGAASAIAPELFATLGGTLHLTHSHPDGRNINEHCGALHPEIVAAETIARKADMGITLDGDADRALFADANGKVVNGDAVLLLAARDLQARGELKDNTVVATTMSNMGLEAALGTDADPHAARTRRRQICVADDAPAQCHSGRRAVRAHPFSLAQHHRRWPADSAAGARHRAALRQGAAPARRRPEGLSAGDRECAGPREAAAGSRFQR